MIHILLKKPISYVDSFFIWAYGSKLNPLQRSGALIVALLSLITVSGTYLLFFYSVSEPYESLQEIQQQWYLGRWIRTFHRYASDAAVLLVIYHSISMLVRGRAWGHRALAWLSGVGLMCALFVSGWTGFVMVWDLHGQEVAQAGTKMFQLVPFLRQDVQASFSGENPLPGSFFFMNLFLHVAIPLGMVLGLWIHISSMGKVKIFPKRVIFILVGSSLAMLSLLWPAPLLEKADVTRVVHTIPFDIWYGFFIPITKNLSAEASAILIALGLLVMITAVFWSSPHFRWKINFRWKPHRPPFVEFRSLVVVRSLLVSLIILVGLAAGSRVPMNMSRAKAMLRFVIEFQNLKKINCHRPRPGEQAGKLSHMRSLEICDKVYLQHFVSITVAGKPVMKDRLYASSSELHLMRDYFSLPVDPGIHHVEVFVETKNAEGEVLDKQKIARSYEVPEGKVLLLKLKEMLK